MAEQETLERALAAQELAVLVWCKSCRPISARTDRAHRPWMSSTDFCNMGNSGIEPDKGKGYELSRNV